MRKTEWGGGELLLNWRTQKHRKGVEIFVVVRKYEFWATWLTAEAHWPFLPSALNFSVDLGLHSLALLTVFNLSFCDGVCICNLTLKKFIELSCMVALEKVVDLWMMSCSWFLQSNYISWPTTDYWPARFLKSDDSYVLTSSLNFLMNKSLTYDDVTDYKSNANRY